MSSKPTFIGPSTPTDPRPGDIWFDPTTGTSLAYTGPGPKPQPKTGPINFDPKKSPKWPYPKTRAEGVMGLPHPRRYLDGDRTRCPDCGAVTRDPSILNSLPCKVETPGADRIEADSIFDFNEVDVVSVNEPNPDFLGSTWFDPSVQVCWIWKLENEGEEGWYDVETGLAKDLQKARQLSLFPLTAKAHPHSKTYAQTMAVTQEMMTLAKDPTIVTEHAVYELKNELFGRLKREKQTALTTPKETITPSPVTHTVDITVSVYTRKVLR